MNWTSVTQPLYANTNSRDHLPQEVNYGLKPTWLSFDGMRSIDNTSRQVLLSKEYLL